MYHHKSEVAGCQPQETRTVCVRVCNLVYVAARYVDEDRDGSLICFCPLDIRYYLYIMVSVCRQFQVLKFSQYHTYLVSYLCNRSIAKKSTVSKRAQWTKQSTASTTAIPMKKTTASSTLLQMYRGEEMTPVGHDRTGTLCLAVTRKPKMLSMI